MCLGKQVAFATIKNWPPFRTAHIVPMNGSAQDSLVYCTKEDKDALVFGTPPGGKIKALDEGISRIRNGHSLRDIAVADEIGARAIAVHGRGLNMLRSLMAPARNVQSPPTIVWLHGPTGHGKSRLSFEFGTLLMGPGRFPWQSSTPDLQWFDGYDGQEVAILEDFRSKGVKFHFVLRLLDRYPMQVPYKGGFVNWSPAFIFITTPKCPAETFEARAQHRPEDIQQLLRRITHVFDFGNPAEVELFRHESPKWIEQFELQRRGPGSNSTVAVATGNPGPGTPPRGGNRVIPDTPEREPLDPRNVLTLLNLRGGTLGAAPAAPIPADPSSAVSSDSIEDSELSMESCRRRSGGSEGGRGNPIVLSSSSSSLD